MGHHVFSRRKRFGEQRVEAAAGFVGDGEACLHERNVSQLVVDVRLLNGSSCYLTYKTTTGVPFATR
jgi:hypothetical protein